MKTGEKALVKFGPCVGKVGEIVHIISTQAGPIYCLLFQNTETHPYIEKQIEVVE